MSQKESNYFFIKQLFYWDFFRFLIDILGMKEYNEFDSSLLACVIKKII